MWRSVDRRVRKPSFAVVVEGGDAQDGLADGTVFTSAVAFNDPPRKITNSLYVETIRYETGGGIGRMLVSRSNVGQVQVIVIFTFVKTMEST